MPVGLSTSIAKLCHFCHTDKLCEHFYRNIPAKRGKWKDCELQLRWGEWSLRTSGLAIKNRVSGVFDWAQLRFESGKRERCFCIKNQKRGVKRVLFEHFFGILGYQKAQKGLVEGVFNAIR